MAETKIPISELKVNQDLNLNNKKITNVEDGSDNKDAINLNQMNQRIEDIETSVNWGVKEF